MTRDDFNKFLDEIRERDYHLLVRKGDDYTNHNEEDRLINFKEIAQFTGLTPIQVWGVLFAKHILSIRTYLNKKELQDESIGSRFSDTRNYLYLGEALIKEESDKANEPY